MTRPSTTAFDGPEDAAPGMRLLDELGLVAKSMSNLAFDLRQAGEQEQARDLSLFDAHDGHPNWEDELSQGRRRGGQGPGVRSRTDQVEPA